MTRIRSATSDADVDLFLQRDDRGNFAFPFRTELSAHNDPNTHARFLTSHFIIQASSCSWSFSNELSFRIVSVAVCSAQFSVFYQYTRRMSAEYKNVSLAYRKRHAESLPEPARPENQKNLC